MRKQKKRLQRYGLFAVIGLSIIGFVALANYEYLQRQAARIPSSIRTELTFSPFVLPLGSREYKATDYKLAEPEKSVQLMSYVITSEDSKVTISQYVQPPQFTDIPEYKDRFLSSIVKQYGTVPTANGTVYLGRQEKQDNKQLAIMIERGLIVLMNPKKDLTDQQWRSIGELLEIQKINN
ncbi:MAG: hypothetical protein ABIR46_00730 [Candidatus Saccharimonadales bacterium]